MGPGGGSCPAPLQPHNPPPGSQPSANKTSHLAASTRQVCTPNCSNKTPRSSSKGIQTSSPRPTPALCVLPGAVSPSEASGSASPAAQPPPLPFLRSLPPSHLHPPARLPLSGGGWCWPTGAGNGTVSSPDIFPLGGLPHPQSVVGRPLPRGFFPSDFSVPSLSCPVSPQRSPPGARGPAATRC